MRIAFIVPGRIDRMSGGSVYDRRVAEGLHALGFRIEFYSVPDLPYWIALVFGPFVSLFLLLRIGLRDRPLILEDWWAHPGLILFNLFLRRRARVIVVVHQLRWREAGILEPLARFIERKDLSTAASIITVSRFMSGEIRQLLPASNPVVARPGVETATAPTNGAALSEARGDAGRRHLLFAGNLVPRKAVEVLLEAVAEVGAQRVALDIAGDCNVDRRYSRRLRTICARLGIEEAVRFHGCVSRERLAGLYANAEIFVMPSVYEGYGMVVAEAVHAGLPVIACAGGPAEEIVQEGRNALLVPPRDSRALAEAIRLLLEDNALRDSFTRGSMEAARSLPTWLDTARIIARVVSPDIGARAETAVQTSTGPE